MCLRAAEPGHHRVVPVVEIALRFLRETEHLAYHSDRKFVGEHASEFHRAHAIMSADQVRLGYVVPIGDHFFGKAFDRRNAMQQRLAHEVLAVEIAPPPMFDAAQFQLRVAQHAIGTAFGNRVVALVVEVTRGDVVVPRHVVAVMQLIVKHGVVIAHDPVIRIGVAKKLWRVEHARIDQRRAIGRVSHVAGLAKRHGRKSLAGGRFVPRRQCLHHRRDGTHVCRLASLFIYHLR